MKDLTRSIVRRTRAITPADLPAEVRALAVQCMQDAIAVSLAGADDELVRILRAELEEAGGTPQAGVWGSRLRLPAGAAALLNGTMAHALDYDDVNLAMPGHPTVAILPAVMALGEARGASGAEVMAAFVVGYETACRVGPVMAPSHYEQVGFHATGTVGTFGAAAGCAHLMGLDEEQTLHALGIAATGGGVQKGRTLWIASHAFPALLVLFALLRLPALNGIVLFAVGITMIINNALVNSRLQEIVPDAMRGRVISLYIMVYIGGSPIGSFVAGVLAKAFGAAWAIGGTAALMLLLALWVFRREPALTAH